MSDDAMPAASFLEGVKAKEAGLGKSANPYAPLTPDHAEWEAGRTATYDLDEDSDRASNREQPADDPTPGAALSAP